MRLNVMKNILNVIPKNSIKKMFFCFQDPHFKKHNWRRRIISKPLLCHYIYLLKNTNKCRGRIYTITDCVELHLWFQECLDSEKRLIEIHADRITNEEIKNLPKHA